MVENTKGIEGVNRMQDLMGVMRVAAKRFSNQRNFNPLPSRPRQYCFLNDFIEYRRTNEGF